METLVLFLLFTVLYGEVALGQGFIYDSYTGNVLCSTQCGALCMENEVCINFTTFIKVKRFLHFKYRLYLLNGSVHHV